MRHTIWLIIKHEVGVTIRQKSFWILTLLVPAILVAVQLLGLTAGDDELLGTEVLDGEGSEQAVADFPVLGLVDQGGVIAAIPPELPPGLFIPYETEAAAEDALRAGELDQIVIVPTDYLETGEVNVLARDFVLSPGSSQKSVAFGNYEWVLHYMLEYNLEPDGTLLTALRNPTPGALATFTSIAPETVDTAADQDTNDVARAVSTIMPFIYYFLLIMGGSYLMRSVVTEKENRTAEVLLLSVPPRQLVTGKMLAMMAVILVQVVVWLGAMYLLLDQRERLLALTGDFDLPTSFIVWAVLFLVAGYVMYGSFLAAAGAISSSSRESQQIIWVLIVPLMPTLLFASEFAENPDGMLAMVLSMFPLTAPSAMVTRIAVAEVPIWQVALSLAGVTIAAYLGLVAAARFFRPNTFLSTEVFSWKRMAAEFRRG